MSARTFPPADLPVFISGWEIECCAPPPVVGNVTSWRLSFEPMTAPAPDDRIPTSMVALPWHVEAWPSPGGPTFTIHRNGVAAYYHDGCDTRTDPRPAPLPGRHLLRGRMFGTRHGGTDHDLFPVTSATVTRIQVVSRELRQGEHVPTAVPGSTQLLDVRRSPKWFSRHPPGPAVTVSSAGDRRWRRRVVPAGLVYRVDVGVLLTISDTPDTLT